jgi:hypothetical protein
MAPAGARLLSGEWRRKLKTVQAQKVNSAMKKYQNPGNDPGFFVGHFFPA